MNKSILRYISKMVVFFAPIFLSVVLLEFTARNIEDSFSFKHKFLKDKGTTVNTLILGNSHAYYGIAPSVLNDSAFSMAMPSQDLPIDFKILETFSTSLPNLNTVIFNVSVSSLFLSNENEVSWRKAYYHFKMHLPDALPSSESIFSRNSLLFSAGLKPVLKSFQYKLSRQNQKAMCLPKGNGFYIREATNSILERTGYDAATRHQKDTAEMATIINQLSLVVDSLIQKKIRVVFVSTPVTEYYSNRISPETSLKINGAIEKIILENPSCVYLNYRDNLKLPVKLFTDADHLNKNGSLEFSNILEEDLKKLPPSNSNPTTLPSGSTHLQRQNLLLFRHKP
jgi:hypothetical protein